MYQPEKLILIFRGGSGRQWEQRADGYVHYRGMCIDPDDDQLEFAGWYEM